MKLKKWIALLLAAMLLLGGCGNSGIIEGDMEATEATEVEETLSAFDKFFTVETQPEVEYLYDYTDKSFFTMQDCYTYAPQATCVGLVDGEPWYMPDDEGYRVSQGACSDGEYAYFSMVKPDGTMVDGVYHDTVRIYKVDMETLEVVGKSGDIHTQHSNSMCYNAKLDKIVIAFCGPEYNKVGIVDAQTLLLEEVVEIPVGAIAIDYNATRDQYVIWKEGWFDIAILDADFNLVKEFPGVDSLLGIQNIHCDDERIYMLSSGCVQDPGKEAIMCYDWDGNYIGVYRIVIQERDGSISMNVGETETLLIHNGEFYIDFNVRDGCTVYKLDIDFDELIW